MRLALAAAMLVACGCGPSPPVAVCTVPAVSVTTPTLVLAGDEVVIEMLFSHTCEPPTRLEVGVLDYSNRSVPATATLDARVGTVKFTPTSGGPHHVTARVQPNRGAVQVDVTVAHDRSGEPGLDVVLPSTTDVQLSDAGYLVAGGRAFELAPFREVFAFTGTVQVRGDVAWAHAVGDVTRFVPVRRADGGLGFDATTPTLTSFGDQVFPTRDDVVGAFGARVTYAHVQRGALVSRAIQYPLMTVVHRLDDSVVGTSAASTCLFHLFDGGTNCTLLGTAGYLGGDSTGFWLGSGFTSGLVLNTATTTSQFTFPEQVNLVGGEAPRFHFRGRDYVAVADRGNIAFEYWGQLVSASTTTVAARVDGGVIRVWRR